jgi:hypothetical protein
MVHETPEKKSRDRQVLLLPYEFGDFNHIVWRCSMFVKKNEPALSLYLKLLMICENFPPKLRMLY